MTRPDDEPTHDVITELADDFAEREFSDAELAAIQSTHRSTARIGESDTE